MGHPLRDVVHFSRFAAAQQGLILSGLAASNDWVQDASPDVISTDVCVISVRLHGSCLPLSYRPFKLSDLCATKPPTFDMSCFIRLGRISCCKNSKFSDCRRACIRDIAVAHTLAVYVPTKEANNLNPSYSPAL